MKRIFSVMILIFSMVVLLTACGGNGGTGGNGGPGANGTNGQSALISVVNEPPGANCPYGGYKLNVGLDTNNNGVLDPSEITSSDYICNGANGTNGTNGTNGFNSLVSIVSEPSGSNCEYGGLKVSSGLDNGTNGGIANDGILQPGEVTSTTYV